MLATPPSGLEEAAIITVVVTVVIAVVVALVIP